MLPTDGHAANTIDRLHEAFRWQDIKNQFRGDAIARLLDVNQLQIGFLIPFACSAHLIQSVVVVAKRFGFGCRRLENCVV